MLLLPTERWDKHLQLLTTTETTLIIITINVCTDFVIYNKWSMGRFKIGHIAGIVFADTNNTFNSFVSAQFAFPKPYNAGPTDIQ
jgi:hypothetical protein